VAAGTDDLQRAVLFNGTHADALGPDGLRDLLEFLDLYVNRVAPQTKVVLRAEAPASLASVFGAPYALAPNRAAAVPDQRAYEAEDDVVVRWERGARDAVACRVDTNTTLFQLTETPCVPDGEGDGAPFGRYETTHATWPPSNATAQRWYLAPDGALTAAAPTVPDDAARGWSSFRYETDPGRTHTGTDPTAGGGIWDKDATYVWEPAPDSDELRFLGPPLATTRHYAGTGSATLFLRSTAPDVDLEVLLTEVRPDGQEILVQSGWLRASHRAEAPGSTALAPEHTHLAATPLPSGAFTRVRVELFPFAHTVRAGSRLALTVSAPGGNRPIWTFGSPEDDDATVNDIGHSLSRRSLLALPDVTTGFTSTPAVPTSLPVCGDLRSQPCRPTPESRRATAVTATFDRGTGTDRVRGVTLDWASPEAAGVTAYSVGELPTGTVTADDATPGLTLSVPAGSVPPPGDPVYTVTATFPGGDGPSSNASLGVVGPSGFRGVPAAAGYRDELDWASTWGAVTGTGPFRGSGATTRASEVRWLWNLHGRPTGFPAHGFTDAPAGGPLGLALRWARAEGIVNVLTGNRFAGGAVLTRATGVRWLWQAAGAPTGAPDHGFTDVGATAPYATALDWAVAEGVVAPAARFRPATALTRGTAVVWLERLAAAV